MNRQELQQAVNAQVRPLTQAIASIERAMNVQEEMVKEASSNQSLMMQKLASASADPRQISSVIADKAAAAVDEVLRERRTGAGEVTALEIQAALAQQQESLLREMGSITEAARQARHNSSIMEFDLLLGQSY